MKDNLIQSIQSKLSMNKRINLPINKGIKEGLQFALKAIKSEQKDYAGIADLETEQGRAIAMLAVDYNLGECKEEVLLNLPVKKK